MVHFTSCLLFPGNIAIFLVGPKMPIMVDHSGTTITRGVLVGGLALERCIPLSKLNTSRKSNWLFEDPKCDDFSGKKTLAGPKRGGLNVGA